VSSEAKAELARANGCEHPIVTRSYAFAEKVKQVTGGRGADVIFDGLGREAAAENLAALARRGHWVSYGQATGALEPVNLAEKSGTFSQPVLFHYTEDFLHPMAGRVFAALRDGILTPDVRHRYPLAAAADAHRALDVPTSRYRTGAPRSRRLRGAPPRGGSAAPPGSRHVVAAMRATPGSAPRTCSPQP